MSLQLYQVDQKSYLLDFKSLSNVDIHESMSSSSSLEGGRMPQSPPSSCSDLGESSPHRHIPCLTLLSRNSHYSVYFHVLRYSHYLITFSQTDCWETAYFSLFVTESEEILWRQKKWHPALCISFRLLCMPGARTSTMPWVGSVRLTWFTGMLFFC